MDNLDTSMLDRMSPGDIDGLPPSVLADLSWMIAEELTVAKRRDKALYDAFERRYAGKASEALLKDGRDTGTVHFSDGTHEVTVTRPKRVKWSQPDLREALDRIDPATAQHIASITFKIDERKYEALMPDTQALLAPARTVETGKATYALSERKAA